MEEKSHQIGTINLVDALAEVFPSMRDDLFDIRQRSFRISDITRSYRFIARAISDLLLRCDDIDLLLDKGIPIVGDFFSNPFTGYWDWNNSPLADLSSLIPDADSFYVMSISCPSWNNYSLNKPDRSRNSDQWKVELAALKRRGTSYRFRWTTPYPVEFANENGAFAFSLMGDLNLFSFTYFDGGAAGGIPPSKISARAYPRSNNPHYLFIFYFDDEESQVLAKIKYPDGQIVRGNGNAF